MVGRRMGSRNPPNKIRCDCDKECKADKLRATVGSISEPIRPVGAVTGAIVCFVAFDTPTVVDVVIGGMYGYIAGEFGRNIVIAATESYTDYLQKRCKDKS